MRNRPLSTITLILQIALCTLVATLPRGTIRPDQLPSSRIASQTASLTSPILNHHYHLPLEIPIQTIESFGLALNQWSIGTTSQGEKNQEKECVQVKPLLIVDESKVQISLQGKQIQNKKWTYLKVTLIIALRNPSPEVQIFLFHNYNIQFSDGSNKKQISQSFRNLLKQNFSPICRHFLQGFKSTSGDHINNIQIQNQQGDQLCSLKISNKLGYPVDILLTIIAFSPFSATTLLSPTNLPNLASQHKFSYIHFINQHGNIGFLAVTEWKCPLSFRYYNQTSQLCQFQCSNNFVGTQINQRWFCQPCHPDCRTCQGQTAADCLSCHTPIFQLHQGHCKCPQGFLQLNGECQQCSTFVENCSICEIKDNKFQCIRCMSNHYLNKSNHECQPCSQGCHLCEDTICLLCEERYILNNGACISPFQPRRLAIGPYVSSGCSYTIPHCINCGRKCMKIVDPSIPKKTWNPQCNTVWSHLAAVTYCIQCDYTYYVSADQFSCQPCPTHCYTCTSSTLCTSCYSTFALLPSGGSTLCLCNSAAYKFYDSVTNQCKPCKYFITNCTTCYKAGSIICTHCATGFGLVANTCVHCPSNCTTCSDVTLACTVCSNPTYSIVGGACRCTETAGSTATFLSPTSGDCLPCSTYQPNCATCSYNIFNNIICTVCDSTYKVELDSCVCDDVNNYYPDPNTGGCSLCSQQIPYCTTCSYNSTNGTIDCLGCQSNALMSVSGTQSICLPCLPNCNACTGTQSTCTSCLTGFSSAPSCSICPLCNACSDVNCMYCNSTNPAQCFTCYPGYFSNVGSCQLCPSGCLLCSQTNSTCTFCNIGFILNAGICECDNARGYFLDSFLSNCFPCSHFTSIINCQSCIDTSGTGTIQCQTCLSGYYAISNLACDPCGSNCLSCTNSTNCAPGQCQPTFINSGGFCTCDNTTAFYDNGTDTCQPCSFFDANCTSCSPQLNAISVKCDTCASFFYVSSNTTTPFCSSCPNYCSSCSSNLLCDSSGCVTGYIWDNSTLNCSCDTSNQYFINISNIPSTCEPCTIDFCVNCSSLTECSDCDTGYFVNFVNYTCLPTICGDGFVSGSEQCDDAGVSGGCDATCKVKMGYVCGTDAFGQSLCSVNSAYKIILAGLEVSSTECNTITFTFTIHGFDNYLTSNFSSIISLPFEFTLYLTLYSQAGNKLTLTYLYYKTYEGRDVTFLFLFSTINSGLPDLDTVVRINADNNIKAIYYSSQDCSNREMIQEVTKYAMYTSYGVLALTAIPCKIVGLELFGVLQLAFFALGSQDGINLMLTPLLALKESNGYAFSSVAKTEENVPSRINGINYDSSFLNNCNLMIAVLVAEAILALSFYGLSLLIVAYASSLAQIAARLIKEVLLTLILFNAFNLAYSAALQFNYSSPDEEYHTYSTILAVLSLVLPTLMCIGLSFSGEQQFGQYKDKFKPNALCKSYFVMTLFYRMGMGYYLASQNEDEMSTLMVMGISIAFLLYNLVNLPFSKAYHNYRANLCHLVNFLTLFVALYYRSMKSTTSNEEVAQIYSPAYAELAAILTCIGVSSIVFGYDAYIYVKQKVQKCQQKDDKDKKEEDKNSSGNEDNADNSLTNMEANKIQVKKETYQEINNITVQDLS